MSQKKKKTGHFPLLRNRDDKNNFSYKIPRGEGGQDGLQLACRLSFVIIAAFLEIAELRKIVKVKGKGGS